MPSEQLRKLFENLIADYRKALELERDLARLIPSGDFQAVSANTTRKQELMSSVQTNYARLLPMLQASRAAEGSVELADEKSEKLRLEAVSLLEKIAKIETANLEAIKKSRDESMAALQQAAASRRAARGYRPSGKSPRFLDTES
ncbi:MAG TPA: hypothetical protein VMX35_09755 [Acidobacteriota bacterium]|nr:hypothetical protein [Acidobacteriota bacterium]